MYSLYPPALVTAAAKPASVYPYIGALAMKGVVVCANHFFKILRAGGVTADAIALLWKAKDIGPEFRFAVADSCKKNRDMTVAVCVRGVGVWE
jgi:hypothetical protein